MLGVLLALVPAKPSLGAVHEGTSYYVSAAGDDANDGLSPLTPWRTLTRVTAAALRPGDTVQLRGGDTFDGPLKTPSSGVERAPIVFTSYGQGLARIVGPSGSAAVYLNSNRFLTFSSLDIGAPSASCVLSSANGTGSSDVLLDHLDIHGRGDAGLNASNDADARITLADSTVRETQGCGVIFRGSSFTITGNEIRNTGIDATGNLTYPLHGIYAKGFEPTITHNTIVDFQTAGITIRSTGSVVERNTIDAPTRGTRGISYYQETAARGTTRIQGNVIHGVSVQGIAIDHGSTTAAFGGSATTASTAESFLITGNTVTMRGDTKHRVVEGIRLLQVPRAVVTGNRVAGTMTRVYTAYAPVAGYSERSNTWRAERSRRAFAWNGSALRFSAYSAVSGQGRGDTFLP